MSSLPRRLHPRNKGCNWMATLEEACKFCPDSGLCNWDVTKMEDAASCSNLKFLSQAFPAEKAGGAWCSVVYKVLFSIYSLSLDSSCFLYQGWILTNKLFIKLKGACSLIILLNVLCLIFASNFRVCMFGFCVVVFFFSSIFSFWLQAKQLVHTVR